MAKLPARTPRPVPEVRIPSEAFLPSVRKRLLRYGLHVIGNRAIPDGRDGLKPVSRRVVWAAYELGATSEAKAQTTGRIVGDCFAAGTMVSTPTGPVAVELAEVGDVARTSRGDYSVTQAFDNPPAPMLQVSLADGKGVVCTIGQEFKVEVNGAFFWKRASELELGDCVVVET